MHSPLLAAYRLAAYIGLTILLAPVQMLLMAVSRKLAAALPRLYHRLCCVILGIDVRVSGMPCASPTLFVANHTSYLDIAVLGMIVPANFVAKSEVGRWPVYGWLARMQRTVFVDRRPRSSRKCRDQLAERLGAGNSLMLFPEGTSSDGTRVLPFKSSLFGAVASASRDHPIQPISVAYVALDGMPIARHIRPTIAWYGAMSLAPHIWTFAGLGRLTVDVRFHPPVRMDDFPSRKVLAAHCHSFVADGLSLALTRGKGPAVIPAIDDQEQNEPHDAGVLAPAGS